MISRWTLVLLSLLHGHVVLVAAQATRAERTGFRETSSHADVLEFLASLERRTTDLQAGTLALSPQGRRVPYVIAARPLVPTPADARRSGKPVIYVQGNIHAGEVEGKEAAQMLLRDLTVGPLRPLLDSIVLIMAPIYNADGNERLGPATENRPGQNGPAVVGTRANGQGLDLNRDYVKSEAPETRGAIQLLQAWEPDLFIDLHTTNGSYHGYALTYAPGLNPNQPAGAAYLREHFLPEVRERMRRRHGHATFWYGNFRNQEPDSLAEGWETYDPRPRFGTNWYGLRGRLSILSEAYSNSEFPARVTATYDFVREILSLAAEERIRLKAAVESPWSPDSIVVRSVLGPPNDGDVIAEITASAGQGSSGFAPRRRTGEYRTIRMPVFDRFVAARQEPRAVGYLLPPRLREVAALLRRQGISVDRLTRRWVGPAERFRIDSVANGPLFEGHRTVSVEGQWRPAGEVRAEAGWLLVRTAQPLGVLAAYLLEPLSEDGVVTWNLLDPELRAGASHPIVRVRGPIRPGTEPLP